MSTTEKAGHIELLCDVLRERHRAIARYRLYHFDCRRPPSLKKKEIQRDLTYEDACKESDRRNAELKAAGKDAFGDPRYGIELTNAWDCMSEDGRARQLALGKTRKDFDR